MDDAPLNEAPPSPAKPARRKPFGPITLCVVLALFGFVAIPIAWVAAMGVLPAPGTMLMVERAFEGKQLRAQWVDLAQIPPSLVRGAMGVEDSGFCGHAGFDFKAIERAMKANARAGNQKRGRIQGGSTISQQTAKNLFAWADRSWARKGVETAYTVLIEALWPKARIMEVYLNIAEWGHGRFGAQAAARGLYGVDARALSDARSYALAAVLASPNRWNPLRPTDYLDDRIGVVAARARAVRAQGLAGCVLGGETPAAGTRKGPRKLPEPLPPLPPPPPDEAPAIEEPGVEEVVDDAAAPAPPAEVAPELRRTSPDDALEGPAPGPPDAPSQPPAEGPP